eukprot:m.217409 g.217409  ORF g.217409 m.217409 type:complete len:314 (-) comp10155_c0_seq30:2639-3580(-)
MRSMIASHRARPLGLAWLFCIAGAIHTGLCSPFSLLTRAAYLCSTNVTSIFIRADTALSRIPLPTHSQVCEEPRLPTSSFDVPFFGACVFSAVLQFVWSMCGAVKLNPRPGTHGHIEGRQRRAAKSPRFAAETTLERIVPYGQTWLIVIVCECTVELSCAPMARATMGHWIRGGLITRPGSDKRSHNIRATCSRQRSLRSNHAQRKGVQPLTPPLGWGWVPRHRGRRGLGARLPARRPARGSLVAAALAAGYSPRGCTGSPRSVAVPHRPGLHPRRPLERLHTIDCAKSSFYEDLFISISTSSDLAICLKFVC